MESLVNFIDNIPQAVWAIIAASGLVSILVQPIKRWLKLQSDKVILALTTVLSFVPVALDALNSATATNPAILGRQTMVVLGVSQLLYRFVVKPFSKLVADAKAERARQGTETVPTPAPLVPEVPLESVQPLTPESEQKPNEFAA